VDYNNEGAFSIFRMLIGNTNLDINYQFNISLFIVSNNYLIHLIHSLLNIQ